MYLFEMYVFTEKQNNEEGGVSGSGEEKTGEPDSCTDDEKQSRLNHGRHCPRKRYNTSCRTKGCVEHPEKLAYDTFNQSGKCLVPGGSNVTWNFRKSSAL